MTALAQRLRLIVQFKVVVALLLARKRIYETLARKTKLMVNIGGGIFLRPHWKVMDYRSPFYPFSRAYIDYDIDLFTKPRFPFADGTVRFFYSSHTLEHIPQEFCPNILAEIHRSLEPGGAVRLTMPDYDKLRRASETDNREYFSRQLSAGLTIEQAVVEQIATDQVDKASPAEVRRNFVSMTPAVFAETYCGRASREVLIRPRSRSAQR